MTNGWKNRNKTGNSVRTESRRHSLASNGIKTGHYSNRTDPKLLKIKENISSKNRIEQLPKFQEVWIKVDGNNLMRQDFNRFINLIKPHSTNLKLYGIDENNVYVKVYTNTESWDNNEELQKKLAGWAFYQPIDFLKKKPTKVSDYDLIEEL